MTNLRRAIPFAVLAALWTSAAGAQTPSTAAAQPAAGASEPAFRLSTTTADGDTGLWYVPTADILARGKWSASGYRVGLNYREGFTNVGDFPITFAVGLADRAEVFGSFKVVTRIDRDIRPLFTTDPKVGGVVARYPLVRQGWSGNNLGDFLVGVKFSLLSEANQKPASVAVRGMIKLPTGDKDSGAGTGKVDGFIDVIASKEARQKVEVSGYGGFSMRGSADNASQSNGFRYGIGAGFPSRSKLRLTTEFNGRRRSTIPSF